MPRQTENRPNFRIGNGYGPSHLVRAQVYSGVYIQKEPNGDEVNQAERTFVRGSTGGGIGLVVLPIFVGVKPSSVRAVVSASQSECPGNGCCCDGECN